MLDGRFEFAPIAHSSGRPEPSDLPCPSHATITIHAVPSHRLPPAEPVCPWRPLKASPRHSTPTPAGPGRAGHGARTTAGYQQPARCHTRRCHPPPPLAPLAPPGEEREGSPAAPRAAVAERRAVRLAPVATPSPGDALAAQSDVVMPLAFWTYSAFGGPIEGGRTSAPAGRLSTESRRRTGGGSDGLRASHGRSRYRRDSEAAPEPLMPRRTDAAETSLHLRSGCVNQREASSGAACHMHLLMCSGPASRSWSQPKRSPSRSSGCAAHLTPPREGRSNTPAHASGSRRLCRISGTPAMPPTPRPRPGCLGPPTSFACVWRLHTAIEASTGQREGRAGCAARTRHRRKPATSRIARRAASRACR